MSSSYPSSSIFGKCCAASSSKSPNPNPCVPEIGNGSPNLMHKSHKCHCAFPDCPLYLLQVQPVYLNDIKFCNFFISCCYTVTTVCHKNDNIRFINCYFSLLTNLCQNGSSPISIPPVSIMLNS